MKLNGTTSKMVNFHSTQIIRSKVMRVHTEKDRYTNELYKLSFVGIQISLKSEYVVRAFVCLLRSLHKSVCIGIKNKIVKKSSKSYKTYS